MRFLVSLLTIILLALPAASQEAAAPVAAPADSGAGEVDALVRILEDDAARARLIEKLRAAEGEAPAAEAAPAEGDFTFARQIAEYTREAAEGAAKALSATGRFFGDLGGAFSSENFADMTRLVLEVLLLVLALIAGFLVLRLLANHLQGMIARRIEGRSWLVRAAGAVPSALLDIGAVVLAWSLGYVLALNLIGPSQGQMRISQTLLLNAFLVVETVKAIIRAVLAPRHPARRLVPLSDTNAAYWWFWLIRLVSLVGYAFMFVTPVLNAYVSRPLGTAVQVLAVVTAVISGIVIVLQNKTAVREMLTRPRADGSPRAWARTLGLFAHFWHLLAIVYLVALLVVWFTNPNGALTFMVGATVQTLVAVVVGVAVVGFISRFIDAGIQLPDDIRARLPLLEARLRTFVPRVIQVVRTLVIIIVVAVVVQAWSIFDVFGWLVSETGQIVAASIVSALLIILVGLVLYVAMSSWVEYRLNPVGGIVPTARERTLLTLFRNAFTVVVAVMAIMLALAQLGVNIAPLIAGAGVLGLAIGFGAQKLVEDIITGVFIQLENVMNTGDVVQAGGISGVVENLTIRSVSIRDLNGTLHLIPFSSVGQVSNMTKGFSFHVANIGVAYREDIAEVKQAMHEAFDRLRQGEFGGEIIEDLDMHGVVELGDSAVVVRARIKTLPGAHWKIGRAYTELVKEVFDERGIEIPFPHVTVYMGEGKDGTAPPLRLARAGAAPGGKTGQDAPPAPPSG